MRALAAAPGLPAAALAIQAVPQLAQGLAGVVPAFGAVDVPRVGDIVGERYRIDERLGSGGMGIVFGATHLSTGRNVALKWLCMRTQNPSVGTEAAMQRFVREAQAVGRIKHPNVVEVFDAGTDLVAPFIVMERLEGETLRARMQREALSWDDALSLLLPAMDGVAEAHRQRVIHRDLKPDNIFLALGQDGAVVPTVLDFGVSRIHLFEDGAADTVPQTHASLLTHPGAVMGTPAYMPLEQLRGTEEVDERCDVYALGVILYEMLARVRPFEARNAFDFTATLASSSPVALAVHRNELRGKRSAVVMKALARERVDRYESVRAFKHALQHANRAPSLTWAMLCGAATLLATALWFGWLRPTPAAPVTAAAQRPVATEATAVQPPVVEATPGANERRSPPVQVAAPAVRITKPRPRPTSPATPAEPASPPARVIPEASLRKEEFPTPQAGVTGPSTSLPSITSPNAPPLNRDEF